MELTAYLELKGFSKAELSRRIGVSKAAISKWKEIPEARLSELMELTPEVPMAEKHKEPEDYTLDEIREICQRRGGHESDPERTMETDWEISRSLGMRIWEFNRMVDRLRHAGR